MPVFYGTFCTSCAFRRGETSYRDLKPCKLQWFLHLRVGPPAPSPGCPRGTLRDPPETTRVPPGTPRYHQITEYPLLFPLCFQYCFHEQRMAREMDSWGSKPSDCRGIVSTHIAKWYTYAMYICLYMTQPPHNQTPNNPATRHLGPPKKTMFGVSRWGHSNFYSPTFFPRP